MGRCAAPSGPRETFDPPFRLGAWLVDPSLNRLSRGDEEAHVEPRVMTVLVCLARRSGQVVTKEEILSRVWPETFVSDVALPRCISELRRALQDDARDPSYIETIPKRGYRLILEPEWIETRSTDEDGQRESPARASPNAGRLLLAALVFGLILALGAGIHRLLEGPAHPVDSLLVLPLRDLSPDGEEAYFAEALTDLLITDLAKTDSLRVISPRSARRLEAAGSAAELDGGAIEAELGRGISAEVEVDAVVRGTVLRAGGKVRITVQLIDADTNENLWAESYVADLENILQVQADLARAIVESVNHRVLGPSAPEPPRLVDTDAYDLYLRGRQLWSRREIEGVWRAVEYFEQSLELDPSNARAYAGLADAYVVLTANGRQSPRELLPRAKEAALRAVQLDEGLAEAHVSLAGVRFFWDWDWEGAEEHFRRGISLNPGYVPGRQWYALFLASRGRFEEAIREIERAIALDPLYYMVHLHAADIYRYAGNLEKAEEATERARALEPDLMAKTHPADLRRGWEELLGGNLEEARRLLAAGVEGTPQDRKAAEALAIVESLVAGKREAALAGVERATLHNALLFATQGDYEAALCLLEESVMNKDPWLVNLAVEPAFAPLRHHPRFVRLLRRLDLPELPAES